MFRKSNITLRLITMICICMFALTSVPMATDSFADKRDKRGGKSVRAVHQQDKRGGKHIRGKHRRGKRHVISPRVSPYGHSVSRLPRGYRRAWHKRKPYFYQRGVFYRPARSGYTVVRAPVGAIIFGLPVGYQRIWIDGGVYYTYGSTFYQRVSTGYVVVDPPSEIIVEDEVPSLIQPSRPATGEVIVDAPVLNVRSGPSLSDPKIYQVDEGYILEIHGRSNGWLYVELPNGEYGWVKSVFTKPVEPASG